MHVNLLPLEIVAKNRLERSVRKWTVAIFLWVTTLVAVTAPLAVRATRLHRDLEQLHSEVGPLRVKENKTQQLHTLITDMNKRSQRIRIVLPPNRIPSLLGIFGKTFQSEDSPIGLQDLAVSIQLDPKKEKILPELPSPSGEKHAGLFSTQIIARGYTGANPSVAEVIQRLEEFGVFQTIQLRSTRDSYVAKQQVDEFELECVYVE